MNKIIDVRFKAMDTCMTPSAVNCAKKKKKKECLISLIHASGNSTENELENSKKISTKRTLGCRYWKNWKKE